MITLAFIFAGTTTVMGQTKPYVVVPTTAPACITPQTLAGCTTDELHPTQGVTYDYIVETTTATDVVRWFVVDNTAMELAGDSLISSLTGILAAANGAIDDGSGSDPYLLSVISGTYNGAGATATAGTPPTSTIQLQWKYFDGVSNEVLLVAYVTSPGCADNIAVFRIIPTPAFTLDIASVDAAGANAAGPTDTPNEECVSPIESAVYNGGATTPDGTLTVDYGENWAFFVINGANYIDSWMPQFQIGYDAGINVAEASWAYLADSDDPTATNWHDLTGTLGGTWTSADPVIAGASASSAGTVGAGVVPAAAGECIVLRVRLDWGTDVEHDQANGTLTVAVDGVAYDGDDSAGTGGGSFFNDRTFADLHHADCTDDNFDNDVVDYIITPRPQVEEGSPVQETKTGQGTN